MKIFAALIFLAVGCGGNEDEESCQFEAIPSATYCQLDFIIGISGNEDGSIALAGWQYDEGSTGPPIDLVLLESLSPVECGIFGETVWVDFNEEGKIDIEYNADLGGMPLGEYTLCNESSVFIPN